MRARAGAFVVLVLTGCPSSGSTTVPTTLAECPEVAVKWDGSVTPGVSAGGTGSEQAIGTQGKLEGTELSTGPGPTAVDDKTFTLPAAPPYPMVTHSLGNASPGCAVEITTIAITPGRPCTGNGTWKLKCEGINPGTGSGTWTF